MHRIILLTDDERREAFTVGHARRRQHAAHRGQIPSPSELRDDALGAVAEMAVAKMFGDDVLRDWKLTRAFTTEDLAQIHCDLGRSIQVRSTPYRSGCLAVRPRDPASFHYVLAITNHEGDEARVRVVGWLFGTDVVGKGDWWKDKNTRPRFPDPAWCAPQSALRPIDTLPPEAVR